MNRKKYDAVATIGEYTTKSGEKKKRYTTIGSVVPRRDNHEESGVFDFTINAG
jgi:hypothetical protein